MVAGRGMKRPRPGVASGWAVIPQNTRSAVQDLVTPTRGTSRSSRRSTALLSAAAILALVGCSVLLKDIVMLPELDGRYSRMLSSRRRANLCRRTSPTSTRSPARPGECPGDADAPVSGEDPPAAAMRSGLLADRGGTGEGGGGESWADVGGWVAPQWQQGSRGHRTVSVGLHRGWGMLTAWYRSRVQIDSFYQMVLRHTCLRCRIWLHQMSQHFSPSRPSQVLTMKSSRTSP